MCKRRRDFALNNISWENLKNVKELSHGYVWLILLFANYSMFWNVKKARRKALIIFDINSISFRHKKNPEKREEKKNRIGRFYFSTWINAQSHFSIKMPMNMNAVGPLTSCTPDGFRYSIQLKLDLLHRFPLSRFLSHVFFCVGISWFSSLKCFYSISMINHFHLI